METDPVARDAILWARHWRTVELKAERDRLREALEAIRDREADGSSTDQTAFFWTWAKRIAREALGPGSGGEHAG